MTTLVEELTQLGTMESLTPPVHILNDYGHVDKDVVHISKSKGEEVQWTNDAQHDAVVIFEVSPFEPRRVFPVPVGRTIPSGPATVEPSPAPYKYMVVGSQGNHDPGVIIDR